MTRSRPTSEDAGHQPFERKRRFPIRPRSSPPDAAATTGGRLEHLTEALYDELRRIARRQLRREGAARSLQTTALVHEAYVRLAAKHDVAWRGRTHFLAAAAGEMRRILVDQARARAASKRGRRPRRVSLAEAPLAVPDRTVEVLALDEALTDLADRSARQAQVAEMRLFAGLLVEEVAEALDVSERTVKDDWRVARAWLARRLRNQPEA
ncbi:MAG TPA: ECF-type sigma factor [Candidatus Eisenbacteria bacterium]|nr:ECF-type sigma factor [Candidatus Eisenbacteria bacterium]